jgi:hypothetical protein
MSCAPSWNELSRPGDRVDLNELSFARRGAEGRRRRVGLIPIDDVIENASPEVEVHMERRILTGRR